MPRAPLWLAAPSRFAAIGAVPARAVLAVALLLMALCRIEPAPEPQRGTYVTQPGESDIDLYETIANGVRHGDDYYAVTARELRARTGYPLRPFITFRLPLLAEIQGTLPSWASTALLYALAAGMVAAWGLRIIEALSRPVPRAIAALLLGGGLVACLHPFLFASHEAWAALLIALSLALRRPGRWVEAIAFATIAMLIRETAALYVMVMAAMAWLEGARREAIGWAAALGVLAAALAAHAWGVAQVTGPLDPSSIGWSGLNGFWFFVQAVRHATVLEAFPFWMAVPTVVLAIVGWASWNSPLALRVLATILAYAVLLSLFARLNNFYWGLMVAPVLLVGLAFAVDGMRDLVRAAFDRRRITVTRIVR